MSTSPTNDSNTEVIAHGTHQPPPTHSSHPLRSAMKHSSCSEGGGSTPPSRTASPTAALFLYQPIPQLANATATTAAPPPTTTTSPNSTASSLFSHSPSPPPQFRQHKGTPPPPRPVLSRDSSYESIDAGNVTSPTSGSMSASTITTPYPRSATSSSILPPFGIKSPSSSGTTPLTPPAGCASPEIPAYPNRASLSYTPKVSFSTLENPVASMFSFTLAAASPQYRRTRATRVFLCAASDDESGREALNWSLESLVQEGDELIVCRGVDEIELERPHAQVRADARAFMADIQAKALAADPSRQVSLILEYIPGKITATLDRLIALYRPDSVVVGTRGRSKWAGLGGAIGGSSVGSVSKYCLTHSPVPIIVVRPERKVRKAIEKRRADPKRGRHFDE